MKHFVVFTFLLMLLVPTKTVLACACCAEEGEWGKTKIETSEVKSLKFKLPVSFQETHFEFDESTKLDVKKIEWLPEMLRIDVVLKKKNISGQVELRYPKKVKFKYADIKQAGFLQKNPTQTMGGGMYHEVEIPLAVSIKGKLSELLVATKTYPTFVLFGEGNRCFSASGMKSYLLQFYLKSTKTGDELPYTLQGTF